MNIKLEIVVENPGDLMDALNTILRGGFVPSARVADVVDQAPGEKLEAEQPARRGRKPGNVVSIADAKKTESAKEAEQPADEPAVDEKADAKAAELAETLDEAPAAPKVEMTVDLVRRFAVKYANDAVKHAGVSDAQEQQSKGREVFQEILKPYGVDKFTAIPADKMVDVHAWIVEQRAAKGLPALDIATLA